MHGENLRKHFVMTMNYFYNVCIKERGDYSIIIKIIFFLGLS